MKKQFITAAALTLLAATAVGAVQVTNSPQASCIPAAVVQAWS